MNGVTATPWPRSEDAYAPGRRSPWRNRALRVYGSGVAVTG
eukprot:CAMPEP_0181370198 /NCGR_PEP_ID=MMETSP1106-20121128/13275_1 /TAXON_ID=81844 /ORGANISM="Mantoniella antarctica, Strain SL-175" /LENGTH=40 /DNA_ID= /DNA_START= /DNA_END= /DNA_ORIENTATION=